MNSMTLRSNVVSVNILCYKRGVQPKSSYHHEHLKQDLLKTAVRLIAEVGPEAFTLREVARRTGVSHNAPYRHFQDKSDLLSAIAAQGFERLTALMHRAMSDGRNAEDRLRLCGRGYVEFSLRWPQHLRVMFDLTEPEKISPESKRAGDRAFQTLLDCIIAMQAEGGLPPRDPRTFAIIAWSSVHGFAKLAIAGRLPFDRSQALDFLNLITAALKEGMRHLPDGPAPLR